MSSEFSGKVVLVTGAGSGMGAAIAKLFSHLGANVVLADKNADALKKVEEQCESPTLLVQADVTRKEDLENIMKKTIKRFEKLNILVNNAGIYEESTIQNASMESYDRVMNTNVRAVFQLTNLAVPYLIESKGNIINIASIAATTTFITGLAYNMSKAAVDHFTRCISLELAPKGVRVNSVNPGVIKTNLLRNAGIDEEASKTYFEIEGRIHPLRRVGEPHEVAELIAFLVSDKAGFITGVSVLIDGGRKLITN